MKVLVADDHSVVRKGLIQIIKEMPEVAEVDEAENGRQVSEKVAAEKYDLIVLDLEMPDKSGLEILQELRVSNPELHILILSNHPEEFYALRTLKAGAAGYLNKNSAPSELATAIRETSLGEKYISKSLAKQLAFNLDANSDKLPHEKLSEREFQVLCLIASGKPVSQIAAELYLSSKTVSTYRSRILEKMNLKNNSEITNYAIKNKIIT